MYGDGSKLFTRARIVNYGDAPNNLNLIRSLFFFGLATSTCRASRLAQFRKLLDIYLFIQGDNYLHPSLPPKYAFYIAMLGD